MHWLIETCVLSDERVAEFREAFDALGVKRTFTLDVEQEPELRRPRPEQGADVIAYGSKSVIAYAAQMQWRPGAWSSAAFDYLNVQRGLGDMLLNANATLTSLEHAEIAAQERGWEKVFIRPADDDKAFAGAVMNASAIAEWRGRLVASGYLRSAAFDVVVVPPQAIGREWRIVLAGDDIAGASLYRDAAGKQLSQGCPAEARALAQAAAKRYRPAPVFVADVAETGNGGLAVIEYNAFNSADLYACDIKSVVEHVTRTAQQGS